jgi:hypothetical protein
MDLRPVVDELRGKNENFDEALGKRRRERLKWGGLAVVALFALAGWTQATVAYARARPTMEFKKPPPPVARAPAPAPERPPGSLTVLCTPECSEVVIDGVPLGPSPIVKRAAAAGVHDVRVSAPNGAKKNYAVVVVSGETHKFRIEMDK